ncbi:MULTISPECIES: rod shape-determining protein [unclassified Streptomyces]|uniref:rod shape-determining protein n=1 Tax=unclassified Streptomyces TaxID=2593676 RepID=UPI0016611CBE|nr:MULTISPECIES: rod shape-determining protein [unclassified Streptomyces]MBD0708835.1 rod shape-determining protein MreC [Streptomyces sp. CBMA291]MBD0717031.1 rod shape-determining protein MreC [Streptomyces sp. CBMA370]
MLGVQGAERPVRGIALDIGSSRTRAWTPGAGVFANVPSGPVRRGRVTEPDSQLRLLRRLAEAAPGGDGHDTVVMLTHPVLAAPEERAAARRLVDALGPTRVIAVDSARAAAAYAAPAGDGPLLVVDLGARLTEVTLVVDGNVTDARLAEVGVDDLPVSGSVPDTVAGTAADMVSDLWRRDRTGAVRGALRRGVLVTGGGALCLDVTGRLAHLLRARVRLANDPQTSVVRGAGLMLASALRHPAGTPPRA